jgi:hypothetical protein
MTEYAAVKEAARIANKEVKLLRLAVKRSVSGAFVLKQSKQPAKKGSRTTSSGKR